MLKKLTEKYISAFNKKDINEVTNLLNENFVLEDPVVKRIEGKEECLKAIENIFKNCNKL
ncbi:nuclear transport factor 2 family protein, partial [Campylobacter jejuni]|nr:nuclear transport factor 2 family protein [Campylobacter jejuni]